MLRAPVSGGVCHRGSSIRSLAAPSRRFMLCNFSFSHSKPNAVVAAACATWAVEEDGRSCLSSDRQGDRCCSTSQSPDSIAAHQPSGQPGACRTSAVATSDIVALLGVCRTVFCCVSICAVWASITSCIPTGGLLASVSLAAGIPVSGKEDPRPCPIDWPWCTHLETRMLRPCHAFVKCT